MEAIEKAFRKIGARVRFGAVNSAEGWRINPSTGRMERPAPSVQVTVDVARDKKGEFFQVNADGSVRMQVLNVAKDTGHMLLFAKDENDAKYRYLCGLDERGWFAAAVPEAVSSVVDAMEALKPDYVTQAQKGLSAKQRNKRKNRAFRRQGEWYFVPALDFEPDQKLILRDEPIRRGRGSPHVVEEVFRSGGETVYISRRHPNGLTPEQYNRLLKDNPKAKSWGWRLMQRNMDVFGRGKVTHRDHRTITLVGWHRILPNRETEAPFIETLVFLD